MQTDEKYLYEDTKKKKKVEDEELQPESVAPSPAAMPNSIQELSSLDIVTSPDDADEPAPVGVPSYNPVKFPELKRTVQRKDLGEDYQSLRDSLERLSKGREEDYSAADNKELMVRAFDAFGKVLAGMYGNKAGVDVSGIKTELPDFSKTYKRIAEKYKDQADLEKEQAALKIGEKESQFKTEKEAEDFANTMGLEKYKGESSAEAARYRGAMDAYSSRLAADSKVAAAKERAAKGVSIKEDKANQIYTKEIKDLGRQINMVLGKPKVNDEVKMQQVRNLLKSNAATANLTDEELKAAFTEKGFLGMESTKEPEEILSATSDILNKALMSRGATPTPRTAAPTSSSGMVDVQLPDGRKGSIPRGAVEKFLRDNRGAKVLN
jgi:hypothetical protein